jgi:hypothetical protein
MNTARSHLDAHSLGLHLGQFPHHPPRGDNFPFGGNHIFGDDISGEPQSFEFLYKDSPDVRRGQGESLFLVLDARR